MGFVCACADLPNFVRLISGLVGAGFEMWGLIKRSLHGMTRG